ncbi:hypothetical protein Hamer_G004362 [Homarus americanus]|uniref:Uncharacterized protein n=1 Tax=Homarus americanus TaxID=6706 RepID=A0A8J5JXM7_HOMAM|nr:hypothetical protein Hamer_G004362 [Homarus americanus]
MRTHQVTFELRNIKSRVKSGGGSDNSNSTNTEDSERITTITPSSPSVLPPASSSVFAISSHPLPQPSLSSSPSSPLVFYTPASNLPLSSPAASSPLFLPFSPTPSSEGSFVFPGQSPSLVPHTSVSPLSTSSSSTLSLPSSSTSISTTLLSRNPSLHTFKPMPGCWEVSAGIYKAPAAPHPFHHTASYSCHPRGGYHSRPPTHGRTRRSSLVEVRSDNVFMDLVRTLASSTRRASTSSIHTCNACDEARMNQVNNNRKNQNTSNNNTREQNNWRRRKTGLVYPLRTGAILPGLVGK